MSEIVPSLSTLKDSFSKPIFGFAKNDEQGWSDKFFKNLSVHKMYLAIEKYKASICFRFFLIDLFTFRHSQQI